MQPPKSPAYSPPRLARFSDREELLQHFAKTDRQKLHQAIRFINEVDDYIRAEMDGAPTKKLARR